MLQECLRSVLVRFDEAPQHGVGLQREAEFADSDISVLCVTLGSLLHFPSGFT